MKYDLTARMFPLLFDRYAYALLRKKGLPVSKKKIRKTYREMVKRTPGLPKDSPFTGNLLMGCYVLSFYKAYPSLINEQIFHELVLALCHSRPMVSGHKNADAFDETMLVQKEKDAVISQNSSFETDWQFTLLRKQNGYDLTYSKCGLCELGRRENCFHLIRYLCEADFITYDLMGADLHRTMTLASGGECCDFHVLRKKEETEC